MMSLFNRVNKQIEITQHGDGEAINNPRHIRQQRLNGGNNGTAQAGHDQYRRGDRDQPFWNIIDNQ
ncbi:hypothetical protein D3C75_1220780 [compost metagenome]